MTAQQEQFSKTWQSAAEHLSFRIEAPFFLKDMKGNQISCVAYLPDFGGPKGIVIELNNPPDFEIDKGLVDAAKAKGISYSFMNFKIYKEYQEDGFKEVLIDWGFFGDESLRPEWMANPVN